MTGTTDLAQFVSAVGGTGEADFSLTAPAGGGEVRVLGGSEVRRVLADTVALMADLGSGRQHVTAHKGELISISEQEAERLEGLDAVVDPDTPPPAEDPDRPAPDLATEAELRGMTVEGLVAYVNQHPDEADRVVALEQDRHRPRKTVLDLAADSEDADEDTDGPQ
jgi:hypothetical protein